MLDVLDRLYAELVFNSRVLLINPTGCQTVDRLRVLAAGLLSIVALRALFQILFTACLRHRAPAYDEAHAPELFRVYDEAVRAIGLRRIPKIHKFQNVRPLAFTIGTLRPMIFLAPGLVRMLSISELRLLLIHELAHVKRFDALRFWALEILGATIPALVVQLFAVHFVTGSGGNLFLVAAIGAVLTFRLGVYPGLICYNEKKCDDIAAEVSNDPISLASSLVRVAQIGSQLPGFRWQSGLTFAQFLAPQRSLLEIRVRRLMNYQRSRIGIVASRLAVTTTLVLLVLLAAVALQFHAQDKTVLLELGCECAFQVTGTVVEKIP